MSDYSELRRLAQRVIDIEAADGDEPIGEAWGEFEAVATPSAVLPMIAENERLTMFNTAYADTITRLNGMIKFEKEQNETLRKDAERYRWLREQHWDSSAICCVVDPKVTTKLGSYCPSLELLDQAVDAGIKLGKETGNG